ncbi:MAG: hypothetical protein ACYC5M_03110 [Anaerolineae bacterium]
MPAHRRLVLALSLCLVLLPWATATPAVAQGSGVTTRVSVASDGAQGISGSSMPSLSADGRYVAFESSASNLVSGDGQPDVFVHDRQSGATTRVSVASDGAQDTGGSFAHSLSADGRYVAFDSANNLVAGDTNGSSDVFVHDRQSGATTRVSVASDGAQGNGGSFAPSLSADGRYVAFDSWASNLVSGDTNFRVHVFVHDRQSGATTLVSVASDGAQGNHNSYDSALSADGRYVAFFSDASNLVAGDTNYRNDIFVHDRQSGATTRVSVASDGAQGVEGSWNPSLSADGRYVAFASDASNLVAGDTNGWWDVFVHDRQSGATTRVSVASDDAQGNHNSYDPALSADGRYVAFFSNASNLVAGDTNGTGDVFVHDRQSGATTRVSLASDGAQGVEGSWEPSLSADGRYVAFASDASNLVAGDTNGWYDVFVHDRQGGIVDPLQITRIEINQALQDEQHTIPLVAGKDTVVRVFLSTPVTVDPTRQSVVIRYDGQTYATLRPAERPGSVTGELSFFAAGLQQGEHTFAATVNGLSDERTVTFQTTRKLRILAVPVKVTGRSAPTETVILEARRFLDKVYPIAARDLVWEIGAELDATGFDLATSQGRARLNLALARRKKLFHHDAVIGFIPPVATVCASSCGSACGCATGWSNSVFGIKVTVVLADGSFVTACADNHVQEVTGMSKTTAHEVGHALGLWDEYNHGYAHFHCDVNPPPPTYSARPWWYTLFPVPPEQTCEGSYQCSSSQALPWPNEQGNGGSKVSSASQHPYEVAGRGALGDKLSFMGSGGEPGDYWVTPDIYQHLFDELKTSWLGSAQSLSVSEAIHVSGLIGQDDSVTLEPMYTITATVEPSTEGAYSVAAVDTVGNVLASQAFDVSFVLFSNPPQALAEAPFEVLVPRPDGTHALQIRRGDVVIEVVTLSTHTPSVVVTAPTSGETVTGQRTITWEGSDLDGDTLHYMVEYSPDGEAWTVLTSGITETQFLADFDALAGGTQARVRVWASDGARSEWTESESFAVAAKLPQVFIESPAPFSRHMTGASVVLHGYAYDRQDGWLYEDAQILWNSDRDGALGSGSSLGLHTLSAGAHTITLTATNSDGLSAQASVHIAISNSTPLYLPLILRNR